MDQLHVRAATDADRTAIWRIVEPHIRSGEVFALPRDMSREAALAHWFAPGNAVFVAELNGKVAGAYHLRANQQGGGAHVANAGYATAVESAGRGVARAMAQHSLHEAKAVGFAAMQFNFVVESNSRAVRLWRSLGFGVVGRLPKAFRHPTLGETDALVLFKEL